MSYELKSAQESAQKHDGTIQSLKDTLKSRESEVTIWQSRTCEETICPIKVDKCSVFYRNGYSQINTIQPSLTQLRQLNLNWYFGVVLFLKSVWASYGLYISFTNMFGTPFHFQTEELYQVIEGQNDTMAKLREMLHQSQLGQLHVCEGHLGGAIVEDVPFTVTDLILLVSSAAQCLPCL